MDVRFFSGDRADSGVGRGSIEPKNMKDRHNADLALQTILQVIFERATSGLLVLVGVDGGAGSGKSTFAQWLEIQIREKDIPVYTVHTDNFFRPSTQRENIIFPLAVVADIDWERLRDQVIIPLRTIEKTRFQLYDWPTDGLKDWVTIDDGGVTIIDGITATRNELSDYYDLRIWFSCPSDIRISRLLGREDTSEAEIRHWMPSEAEYIATHRPDQNAHLIIDSTADWTSECRFGWVSRKWLPLGD
jgi:uridine kinase